MRKGEPGYCSICADPVRLNFVENARAMGNVPFAIERLTRDPAAQDLGLRPIKEETIKRHFVHQGTTDRWAPQPTGAEVKRKRRESTLVIDRSASPQKDETAPTSALAEQVSVVEVVPHVDPPALAPMPPGELHPKEEKALDVASVVAQKAMEGLVDGTLRVTTQHGLQAQAMLDRREERRKDRELSIQLARVLSGAVKVPSHLIIDSTAKDVTPLELRQVAEALQE